MQYLSNARFDFDPFPLLVRLQQLCHISENLKIDVYPSLALIFIVQHVSCIHSLSFVMHTLPTTANLKHLLGSLCTELPISFFEYPEYRLDIDILVGFPSVELPSENVKQNMTLLHQTDCNIHIIPFMRYNARGSAFCAL